MYSQEESLAFCAGQCQASRFPPNSCRCICQGRNHGILFRHSRIIDTHAVKKSHDQEFEEWLAYTSPKQIAPLPQLPHIQPKPVTVPQPKPIVEFRKGKARISILKKITGYRSSDDLNSQILDGLHNQFNQTRIDGIVDQAFSIFYQRMGPDANRPELYELYENGDVDRALALSNVRWVIGRPKKR